MELTVRIFRTVGSFFVDCREDTCFHTILAPARRKMAGPIDKAVQKVQEQEVATQTATAAYNRAASAARELASQNELARNAIASAKVHAGELERRFATASGAGELMSDAVSKADKNMKKFTARIKGLAKRVFIFTLITAALRNMRAWMGKVIKTNDEATVAIARLKGAFLTLAQPLVDVAIPEFTAFVNVLTKIVTVISRLVSAIFGKTIKQSSEAAKNLYDEENALSGVSGAAKEAKGALAGFDEINKLVSETASSGGAAGVDAITPDFSEIAKIPEMIESLLSDLEIKIRDISFSWDKGEISKNKDAWIVFLFGLLGAVLGGMFGGLYGAVIGLLLGAAIGLVSCTFLDKVENSGLAKETMIVVLSAILGAVLGTMFGGFVGGVIGLLLGASIAIISLEFTMGEASAWDPKNTIIIVLSSILGAILGSLFGGLVGGVIGFLLGGLISFTAIKFSGGNFNKENAIASLRIVLFAILGAIFGTMFGGLVGGVVGAVLGMTIGFATVAFDEKLSTQARTEASNALKIALCAIIGALIGAIFGGGVFGGIVGGVIGLTFGIAVTLSKASIKNSTGFSSSSRGGGFSASAQSAISTTSIPALATGAVIPPNREFLAVLGDQKSGTNIEAPLATIEQALANVMSRQGTDQKITIEFTGDLAALARVLNPHIKNENNRIGGSLVVQK